MYFIVNLKKWNTFKFQNLNLQYPMKRNLQKAAPMTYVLMFALAFQSCSKDSDLLSDYVINKNDQNLALSKYVVNDDFFISPFEIPTVYRDCERCSVIVLIGHHAFIKNFCPHNDGMNDICRHYNTPFCGLWCVENDRNTLRANEQNVKMKYYFEVL